SLHLDRASRSFLGSVDHEPQTASVTHERNRTTLKVNNSRALIGATARLRERERVTVPRDAVESERAANRTLQRHGRERPIPDGPQAIRADVVRDDNVGSRLRERIREISKPAHDRRILAPRVANLDRPCATRETDEGES